MELLRDSQQAREMCVVLEKVGRRGEGKAEKRERCGLEKEKEEK